MEKRFDELYEGLKELTKVVIDSHYPTIALKIAGSRVDIAFSSQQEEDVRKAERALNNARKVCRLYKMEMIAEPLIISEEMRRELWNDHPRHYLLDDN